MSTSGFPSRIGPIRMSEHRSFPKSAPRIKERMATQRAEAAAWIACCRAVDAREHYRCRVCGRRTERTLGMVAARGEHHHLVPRRIAPALVWDVRNVILVCAFPCHRALTRHEIEPIGEAATMFEHDGRHYLDANQPLSFL